MLIEFTSRTAWALLVALVAALVVQAVGDSIQATLVALVGGAATALMAGSASEREAPEPALSTPSIIGAPVIPPLLNEALDAVVEPVLLVREGRIALANRAATALLGAHIVGQDARLAIRHPAATERLVATDPARDDRPVELVGLGTLDQRWEMRVGHASDGTRIVHLIDQTGNYAAERMRVDFVANASHELRTPLASILGFIETLGDEAGEDAAVRARFLSIMGDEAQRMQRLVEDLISLSRIEGEKYRPLTEVIDLGRLMLAVRGELAAAAGARGQDLVATIEPDVPTVAGDRAQLSQLLHNLIGNAMKYGRAGTPVVIRLGRDDRAMVRLSVTDESDGIAPEHLPRLTERFYRVDSGRSRSLGGTGLGLAIVKHIVERHRGRLDITSRVGVGTVVTVVVPGGDVTKP